MLHIFISRRRGARAARRHRQGRARLPRRVVDDDGHAAAARHGRPARGARARPAAATSTTRARRATCKDGWNYTGDAYLVDADGYFHYQSRTDDMIVSAGYNIAAPEVEDALLRASGGGRVRRGRRRPTRSAARSSRRSSCCAAGHARRRRRWCSELQDFVKATIAPYKYPRAIEFVDALPRTETGKLQRFRLRGT